MAPRSVKEYQLALCTMNVQLPSGKLTLAEYQRMYESAIASRPPVTAPAPAPGSARGKRRQSEITSSPAAPTPKSSKRRAQSMGIPSALPTPPLPPVPAPNANVPLGQQKPSPQNANVPLGMQSPLQNPSTRHSTQQPPQLPTEQLRMHLSPKSADVLSTTQQPLQNSNVSLRMQTPSPQSADVLSSTQQPLQNTNVPLRMQTSTGNTRREIQPPHVPYVPSPPLQPPRPPLPAPDELLSPASPYDFSPQPDPVVQPVSPAPIRPGTPRRYLGAFTSSKKLLHLLALLALLLAIGIGLERKTAAFVPTLGQVSHVSPTPTIREAADELNATQAEAFPAGGGKYADASYAEVNDKDEVQIESPVDEGGEGAAEHGAGGEVELPPAQAAGEGSGSVGNYSRPNESHSASTFSLLVARFLPSVLQESFNSLGAALSPLRLLRLLGSALGFILEMVSFIFLLALRNLGFVVQRTPDIIYKVMYFAFLEPQKALALPLIGVAAFFARRALLWHGRWRSRRAVQQRERIDEATRWLVRQLREHHEAWSSASGAGRHLSPASLREKMRAHKPELLGVSERLWAEIQREVRETSCVQVVSNSQNSEECWAFAPM